MEITLYPHQQRQIDELKRQLTRHPGAILAANPGVGKTRMAKWIMAAARSRGSRSLFAVHRRNLVDNACESFSEPPELPHGVIMSGREPDWSQRVQVASIDTKLSWFCDDNAYKTDLTFDLVVFDECHSHLAKFARWLELHNKKRDELKLKPAFAIGLSATPACKGLSDVFGSIVTGPTTEWLIENGYLSAFRYVRATQGRLNLLVKQGREYTPDSVSAAMDGLSGHLVDDWYKWAEGRPTVGFFPRLSHAREAQAALNRAGVNAEYVDGNTPDTTRRALFKLLAAGDIDYLCNVGVVERGTNIPRIACVQLCTAIGSVVRYRQMIGRGSRVHPQKTDCLVIDHAHNVRRHGFFEDEIGWSLDNTDIALAEHEPRATIECPKCGEIYRGGRCRKCGYEPEQRERKAQGLVFTGAELEEVQRKRRKTNVNPPTNEQIMISALYAAGKSGRTWAQAVYIARAIAQKKGVIFRVPSEIHVGGRSYKMLRYGSPERSRLVRDLYQFTGGRK